MSKKETIIGVTSLEIVSVEALKSQQQQHSLWKAETDHHMFSVLHLSKAFYQMTPVIFGHSNRTKNRNCIWRFLSSKFSLTFCFLYCYKMWNLILKNVSIEISLLTWIELTVEAGILIVPVRLSRKESLGPRNLKFFEVPVQSWFFLSGQSIKNLYLSDNCIPL